MFAGVEATEEWVSPVARVLREVFGAERFTDDFVRWMYLRNPLGPAYCAQVVRDGRVVCHNGVLPRQVMSRSGVVPVGLSLNAATAGEARREGLHLGVTDDLVETGFALGYAAVFGVVNSESLLSTAGVNPNVIGALPVRAAPRGPRAARGWSTIEVTEAVADRAVEIVAPALDRPARFGVRNHWTPETLQWRLSAPPGGRYSLHWSDTLAAVTTVDHFRGRRVAVLLKVWPRRRNDNTPLAVRTSDLAAICAAHHAMGWVHAGWNADVSLPGVSVPAKLRPVPLVMIGRINPDTVVTQDLRFDVFEFLDFDAY